jgi:hypothetical protein
LRQLARAEAEAEESGKHIAVTEKNGASHSSRAAKQKPLGEKP